MFTLKNEALEVSILDPVADQEKMGTRYCTGGYIFSIVDPRYGNLLSGPTYPDSFNAFDGQGIPDAFNLGPLTTAGQPRHPRAPKLPEGNDAHVLILGIGVCDMNTNSVVTWCDWKVEAEPAEIRFSTQHAFRGYDVALTRTVTLTERTVRSQTHIKNAGRPMALRWFPHPFYPQPATDELVKFNIPVSFPENEGYEMGASGFIRRKHWPWTRGPYQALDHDATTNLVVLQRHPKLGLVGATCSYVPNFFPIWGNANTFSWEPFFERSVAPGQEVSWSIAYDF